MRIRLQQFAVGAVVCLTAVVASCGSPGPLTLQLAETQAISGVNRTMESPQGFTVSPDAVTYSVVGDLTTPRVSGFAFSIGSKPEAKDWLRRLAVAVNIQGDIVKENKNNFTIGLNKETGAGVWLWADDAGSWWSYNNGSSSSSVSTAPCDPASGDCSQASPPSTTPAPTNLLPVNEAVAQATRFLLQVGFELKGFRLRGIETANATLVEGELVVSSIPTNMLFRFVFGQDGVMTNASGPLATLKRANGYYLITPEEGIARLKSPRYTSIGATTRAAAETGAAPGGASGPIAVAISRVEYTLMQAVLANTTTILLPAYTYYNDDGVVGTVIAMKDENLTFGQLPMTSDEPSTLNNGGAVAGGGSSGAPGSGAGAIAPLTNETAKVLIGLAEEEAVKVATANGWSTRVQMRDGEGFPLTLEYDASRVNFTISKGVVTAVNIG